MAALGVVVSTRQTLYSQSRGSESKSMHGLRQAHRGASRAAITGLGAGRYLEAAVCARYRSLRVFRDCRRVAKIGAR